MHVPLFYRSKPLFGLDVGRSTVKVVQLKAARHGTRVLGYGYVDFNPSVVHNGEIGKPDVLAQAITPLLKQLVIGKITSTRVVASVPTAHTFIRIVRLPKMDDKDRDAAVTLEAKQYIPVDNSQLYLEHMVLAPTSSTSKTDDEEDVLLVAIPQKIVTSYIALFEMLGLEIHAIEPSILAIMRAVLFAQPSHGPRIVIDFGSDSSDLAIYDTAVRLTSTITAGSNHVTEIIAQTLNLTDEQATNIKTRYGITKSRWQAKLVAALQPMLNDLADEVQKMMRYYRERTDQQATITHIMIVGGGSNLPGLSDFLAHLTGLEVSILDPWQQLQMRPLQPPHHLETTLFTTAVGLALQEVER